MIRVELHPKIRHAAGRIAHGCAHAPREIAGLLVVHAIVEHAGMTLGIFGIAATYLVILAFAPYDGAAS